MQVRVASSLIEADISDDWCPKARTPSTVEQNLGELEAHRNVIVSEVNVPCGVRARSKSDTGKVADQSAIWIDSAFVSNVIFFSDSLVRAVRK